MMGQPLNLRPDLLDPDLVPVMDGFAGAPERRVGARRTARCRLAVAQPAVSGPELREVIAAPAVTANRLVADGQPSSARRLRWRRAGQCHRPRTIGAAPGVGLTGRTLIPARAGSLADTR
jgi:hypothetical protein